MCTSTTPQYEFNNLLPANEYIFQIWSESTAGWSNSSPILCFITAPEVPAQPDTVELLKITPNGLVIRWHSAEYDNGAVIDCYEIEVSFANASHSFVRIVKHRSTTLLHRYTLCIYGNRDYSVVEFLF